MITRVTRQPGITTEEIDRRVHEFVTNAGAYPSPLGYPCDESAGLPFPKSICTSVNEVRFRGLLFTYPCQVMAHGIPDSRVLCEGDIVTIDVTVYLDGFHGDCATTFCVGQK